MDSVDAATEPRRAHGRHRLPQSPRCCVNRKSHRDHGGRAERGNARRPFHKLLGLLDDALMLLLVIWLFPLVILLVGAPVALLVRLLIEITNRM